MGFQKPTLKLTFYLVEVSKSVFLQNKYGQYFHFHLDYARKIDTNCIQSNDICNREFMPWQLPKNRTQPKEDSHFALLFVAKSLFSTHLPYNKKMEVSEWRKNLRSVIEMPFCVLCNIVKNPSLQTDNKVSYKKSIMNEI